MSKWKKIVLVSLLALAGAGALSYGIYWYWLHTPPAMPNSVEQAMRVFESPRFGVLAEDRKQAYVERAQDLMSSLSPEEQAQVFQKIRDDSTLRQGMREGMEAMIGATAREYALADPAEKTAILDKTIQQMESMRNLGRMFGGGPATRPADGSRGASGGGPGGRGGSGGGRNTERMMEHMRERVSHGNPQRQAYMMQFFRDLRARREALQKK